MYIVDRSHSKMERKLRDEADRPLEVKSYFRLFEQGGRYGGVLGKDGLRIRSGIGEGGVCGGREGEGKFCWASVGGVGLTKGDNEILEKN
ncbi:hypothetical protein ACFX15_046297 [Malus domestica]